MGSSKDFSMVPRQISVSGSVVVIRRYYKKLSFMIPSQRFIHTLTFNRFAHKHCQIGKHREGSVVEKFVMKRAER